MEVKTFTILSFTRNDLHGFLSQEQLARLSDNDLEDIATELRQILTLEMSLAEMLEFFVKFYLTFKK
jgi:hypothetical protein